MRQITWTTDDIPTEYFNRLPEGKRPLGRPWSRWKDTVKNKCYINSV